MGDRAYDTIYQISCGKVNIRLKQADTCLESAFMWPTLPRQYASRITPNCTETAGMCTSDLQKVNRKEDLSNTSGPQMKILLYSIMKLTNDSYKRKKKN